MYDWLAINNKAKSIKFIDINPLTTYPDHERLSTPLTFTS